MVRMKHNFLTNCPFPFKLQRYSILKFIPKGLQPHDLRPY